MKAGSDWSEGDRSVLLIADPSSATDAADAVALAGGRLLGQVEWDAAGDRLERQAVLRVVVAEARGVDQATLAAVLPRLDALARLDGSGRGMQVIVTMSTDQIDLVAASLFGGHVALLCEPTTADSVAAIALALADDTDNSLHDSGREAEAARLRRLNEEVARIAETLARLTRGSESNEMPRGLADRTIGYGAPPLTVGDAATDPPAIAARTVRDAIRARRLRDQIFGPGLFEDPAWDMLLDLFAAELERAQVSVSSLCIAAAVAPTTALRWIAKLTEIGLFERQPDPFDRRRAYMALSPRARDGMRAYIAAVRRGGLPMA